MNPLRTIALSTLCVAALGLSACGGDDDVQEAAKTVQEQGQELRQRAQDAQTEARRIAEQMQEGEIGAAEGQRKIEELTGGLTDDAADLAKEQIDQVEDLDGVDGAAKEQLDDAQDQLDDLQRQTP